MFISGIETQSHQDEHTNEQKSDRPVAPLRACCKSIGSPTTNQSERLEKNQARTCLRLFMLTTCDKPPLFSALACHNVVLVPKNGRESSFLVSVCSF